MTASALFSVFSTLALLGWITLAVGVALNKPLLSETIAGTWLPVVMSAAYTGLIVMFFADSPGGFGSLQDVQQLFTSQWIALAGWIHYLAFDLFVGAYIAREVKGLGLARWPLIGLLPLTFLFGPAGYLAFETWKTVSRGEEK